MVRPVIGAVLGLFLTACGSNEKPTVAGAGAGGAAGASLTGGATGTGGSSGGAGQNGTRRGAFSMHIVPGPGCSLADQWVDLPVVDGGHPVTATETVQTMADGATAQVTNSSGMLIDTRVSQLVCRWGSRDPAFDLSVGFRFGPAGREGVLSMSAGITVGQSRNLGIVLQAQDWGDTTYGGQCTYTALEVDDATRSVRGEVSCPALDPVTDEPSTQPNEICTLAGYYAFENCTAP